MKKILSHINSNINCSKSLLKPKNIVNSYSLISKINKFSISQNLNSIFFSNVKEKNFSTYQNNHILYNFSSKSFSYPKHTILTLPSLSPSMEKGGIAEWKKKEGDQFSAGESIASIETDKATVDFEMTDNGYLAKILMPVGTKDLALGTAIAVTVKNKGDVNAFKDFALMKTEKKSEETSKQQASSSSNTSNNKSNNSTYPQHKKLPLPNLSPSMEKGNILEWKIKEGEKFIEGQALASIETDKAAVDFEMTESGYLAKILKPAGSKEISLGTVSNFKFQVIAIIVSKKDDVSAFKNYTEESSNSTPSSQNASNQNNDSHRNSSNSSNTSNSNSTNSGKVFASPLAKKEAKSNAIDLNQVKGTGPNSRIIKADIDDFKNNSAQLKVSNNLNTQTSSQELHAEKTKIESTSHVQSSINTSTSNQSLSGTYKDVPVSQIRKIIAERLVLSKTTIPHFYLNTECNVDKLISLRERLNKVSPVKISFNDLIIKASALACMKVPETNSYWQKDFIRMHNQCDVSVAVQTDNGLITPIVFKADTKRLSEIALDMKTLATKAKEGKLKPQEFQGGTFTVSNLGMMGISSFSAIINPPQSCILAVGRSEKKVIYDETNKDSPYKVINVINSTLSCDHRTVDGAVGAKWINEFRQLMENPELMLLQKY